MGIWEAVSAAGDSSEMGMTVGAAAGAEEKEEAAGEVAVRAAVKGVGITAEAKMGVAVSEVVAPEGAARAALEAGAE